MVAEREADKRRLEAAAARDAYRTAGATDRATAAASHAQCAMRRSAGPFAGYHAPRSSRCWATPSMTSNGSRRSTPRLRPNPSAVTTTGRRAALRAAPRPGGAGASSRNSTTPSVGVAGLGGPGILGSQPGEVTTRAPTARRSAPKRACRGSTLDSLWSVRASSVRAPWRATTSRRASSTRMSAGWATTRTSASERASAPSPVSSAARIRATSRAIAASRVGPSRARPAILATARTASRPSGGGSRSASRRAVPLERAPGARPLIRRCAARRR